MKPRINPPNPPRRRAAGFASFVAVALMGTSAFALAAVTVRQMQRTRDAAADAQLRLMILDAHAYLPQTPTAQDEQRIALPDPGDDTGSIHLVQNTDTNDNPAATLTATLRGRTATATLTYDHENEQWAITEIELP